jgi:hypothetical protein
MSNAAESRTLEFKQDLQIATDDQKRELLSDVTTPDILGWTQSRSKFSIYVLFATSSRKRMAMRLKH